MPSRILATPGSNGHGTAPMRVLVLVADARASSRTTGSVPQLGLRSIAHEADLARSASHRLAQQLGLTVTGRRSLTISHWCSECHSRDHGAPFFKEEPDLHLSVSHAFPWVAAAVAQVQVGVDIEPRKELATGTPRTFDDLYCAALTPNERAWVMASVDTSEAFLRLWTRKEALIKVGAGDLDLVGQRDVMEDPGPRSQESLSGVLCTEVAGDYVLSIAHAPGVTVEVAEGIGQ